jgi:hypothetical protein
MSALRASVRRRFGQSAFAFVVALAAVALCGSQSAIAGLIGTNYYVRYDGSVRNGANVGVEGHNNTLPFGTNNIPTHEIPVTINPPAPLSNARVLTVTETAFLGPMDTTHAILDIQGKFSAGGPTVFVNNLDATLAFPVVFEGRFYDSDPTKALVLDLNKMIDVGGGVFHDTVELENVGDFYKLPLAQKHVSGSGTINDPLRIVLDIPASMVSVNRGRVKVHLYFGETDSTVIPEPATAALVLIGLTGLGFARRRGVRG